MKKAYATVPKDQWFEESEFRSYYKAVQMETDESVVTTAFKQMQELVEEMNPSYYDSFRKAFKKKLRTKDEIPAFIILLETNKSKLADSTFTIKP